MLILAPMPLFSFTCSFLERHSSAIAPFSKEPSDTDNDQTQLQQDIENCYCFVLSGGHQGYYRKNKVTLSVGSNLLAD